MNTRDPELDFDDVSRAYRDAAHDMLNEKPSAAIDDAIRAAARRGVSAGPYSVAPRKSWFARVATPFAAAATVLLTGSLIFVANRESPEKFKHPLDTKTVAEEKVAAAPVAPPEPAVAQMPATAPAANAARADESKRRQMSQPAQSDSTLSRSAGLTASAPVAPVITPPTKTLQAPAATIPPPPTVIASAPQSAATPEPPMKKSPTSAAPVARQSAPTPAPVTAAEATAALAASASEVRERAPASGAVIAQTQSVKDKNESIVGTAAKADLSPPAFATSPARTAISEPSESQWIKRMGTLQAEGKTEQLRAELRRFRKAYPSAELPAALQDEWVKMSEEQAAKTPDGQR